MIIVNQSIIASAIMCIDNQLKVHFDCVLMCLASMWTCECVGNALECVVLYSLVHFLLDEMTHNSPVLFNKRAKSAYSFALVLITFCCSNSSHLWSSCYLSSLFQIRKKEWSFSLMSCYAGWLVQFYFYSEESAKISFGASSFKGQLYICKGICNKRSIFLMQ
jgi:hypothetical protein